MSPDWYLVLAVLAGASVLTPMLPLLQWLSLFTLVAGAVTLAYAVAGAWRADLPAATAVIRTHPEPDLAVDSSRDLLDRQLRILAPQRLHPPAGLASG